jgi:UDPglucose--hexose-1-phosphate uridylyltransferase
MHTLSLTKDDGRTLRLYSRAATPAADCVLSPGRSPQPPNAHLRWHPLRGEWVAYATHRQHRTFLPPPEYNPLLASCDAANPTEVPKGSWDVAVFENLFPTFTAAAHDPPHLTVPTREGHGACEVVVFTQDPSSSLGALPLWQLELIVDVWAERQCELGSRPEVQYVFPFENRGKEVGVTLHHPHGQIYAYPFVPPVPARELEQQRAYYEKHGRGLLADLVKEEVSEGARMLYHGSLVGAFMPVCARYSYEVWIAPFRPAASLMELTQAERADFAAALKTVLLKFDGLWNAPFPYILVIHQSPTDGAPHPEAHVHAELYPAYRMRDRLKYLAGSELGAGVFTADTIPEETVKDLQRVEVNVHA